MKSFFFTTLIICFTSSLIAQINHHTRQDSLRGSITPEREWWDLTYYHLSLEVKPDEKYISGKNIINYKVLKPYSVMQIDLQPPLKLTKAIQNGKELKIRNEGNAHFISLPDQQKINTHMSLDVYFEGNPKEAVRAPWDGGFSWKKDNNGNHFIATSCQGLGASVWWPNKDHMYDEVDSMDIVVTVPKGLMNVSNGILKSTKENENTTTYHWFVSNPINNYGVNVNIGDYVNFSENYIGEKGNLELNYYVLRDNLEKAKKQFKQTPMMLQAFEYWFGPYPFYEDGFKLVEVPYLGMEHQSSVTYGNHFQNGYLGNDLSGTGWGLEFDFIIIHESGHEWFANNITYIDIADMWIHESFTNYSESLYLDYHFGKVAAAEYVIGTRRGIRNETPIIGPYNVNKAGSGDMYPKGGNLLHTLRQLVNDDEQWRKILRGLNSTFYHQTVGTQQIEAYINQRIEYDLTPFFNQYLRDFRIPVLEYSIKNGELKYRWTDVVDDFDMPIQTIIDDKEHWLKPIQKWQIMKIKGSTIEVDPDFYVYTKNID